jgi:hypothetical protein
VSPLLSPRLLPLLLSLVACDSWPRYSNLPNQDATVDVDQEDPAASVPVSWAFAAEPDLLVLPGADNGDPRASMVTPIVPLEGLVVDGVLRGIGFNADFAPPVLQAEGCDAAQRLPAGEGDWAGDVDFYRVDLAEPAVLCASLSLPGEQLGWDLLLYPLDSCGLPQAPVEVGDTPLGWNRSGRTGGWKSRVEAGSWAVLLAGYSAPSPVAEYRYRVALSAVPTSPAAPGSEICPSLPEGDE